VGGVLDIVDDGVNGLLLPVGDEKKLAELMETLVADPERAARLGRNARADAMIRYDRRHNVERFVAMLDEIDMRRPGL
jgi:starch synthase